MNGKSIHQSGFTLIELLVTLAVVVILVGVAGPAFTDFVKNTQISTQSNNLMRALNLTRSEAVKRGSQVTLCKSANQTSCITTGNWEQGWIVFADGNGDGVIDSGETIIRVQDSLPSRYTVKTGGNFANWVGYLPSGMADGSGSFGNDTFSICADNDTNYSRHIVVSIGGRAHLKVGNSC